MAVKFTNVSNPAAFGVTWATESGSRHELVNIRGTGTLRYGVRVKGAPEWSTVVVENPHRFGLVDPPESYTEFALIARRFIES